MNVITSKAILDKGEVALLSYSGSDASIAEAARVSYKKGTKRVSTDAQLIRYLIRNKHTSPLEQTFLQFYIKAPIFVMRQWMRHRTWSYNEVSGRFSELVYEAYLPLPEHVTGQDFKNKQSRTDQKVKNADEVVGRLQTGQGEAFSDYQEFLNAGVAREIARINLPVSTYTEVIAAVDLHNLLHFLELRFNGHAQYEIRVAAEAMYEMMCGIFPDTMKAWDDCVLKSFTLTGQMQEALAMAINMSSCYDDWGLCAKEAADKFTWASSSEKDQFINWCITKLKV